LRSRSSDILLLLLLLGLGFLDLLLLDVDHLDIFLRVDASSHIENVKAKRVLLDLQLVLACCQVLEHESKAISVAFELAVNEAELLLLSLTFMLLNGLDLEEFDGDLLEAWASCWIHAMRIQFSAYVCFQLGLLAPFLGGVSLNP